MMEKFSVCMSVYKNDNSSDFFAAVNSIYKQTCQPDEIIIVVDGPVPESMESTISELQRLIPIMKVIPLAQNMGHAIARQTGLDAAQYDYIAIMDSDDIAVSDRFEKQMAYIEAHPEVDALGGQIDEFIGDQSNVMGTRIVPQTDAEIKSYLKSRCPMNLVTVMLKKDSVQKVGGYIDWYCEEDYYLWVRMVEQGMTFANLPDSLVNVRVGGEMYQRRGGMKYFKSEAKLQRYMFKHGIISFPRYLFNVAGRFAVQVAMPNTVRSYVFQKLFRR